MSVYIKIKGRFGNQFLQYATARKIINCRGNHDNLYIKFDEDPQFDTLFLGDQLREFNTINYMPYMEYKNQLWKRVLYYIYRKIDRESWPAKKMRTVLFENGFWVTNYNDDKFVAPKTEDVYVEGNFEGLQYFDSIREILLEEFTPKNVVNKKYDDFLQKIKNENTVCVSVRVWPREEVNERRVQLGRKFFDKALAEILSRVPIDKEISVCVFSDNIEWINDNINFSDSRIKEVFYEPDGLSVSDKIWAMTSCKYFILSNSTFSWIVAYLSREKEKIVCIPRCEGLGIFDKCDCPDGVNIENWVVIESQ